MTKSSSQFHYSPYLMESASETRAWVATVGNVVSYGIPSGEHELEIQLPLEPRSDDTAPATSFPWAEKLPTLQEIELSLR